MKLQIKKILIIFSICCLLSTNFQTQDGKKNTACLAIKTLSQQEKAFFQLLALKLSSYGYKPIYSNRCLYDKGIVLTNYHSQLHNLTNPIYFFDFKSSQIFSRPPIQNNYTEIYTDKQTDKNEPYIDLNNLHTSVVKIAKDIQLKKFQNKYFKITLVSSHGLGNQLFNYATGYAYAKRYNKKTFLANYSNDITHAFHIPEKNIPITEKLFYLKNFKNPEKTTGHSTLDKNLFIYNHYGSVSWYHQSYWNIHDAIPELQENLKFKPFQTEQNIKLAKKIESENSVSIHIRLGNYVNQGYPLLIYSNYYENAIKYIQQHVPNPVFYIFTNDINYVEKYFKPNVPYTLVTGNTGKNSFRDMQLMSLCKHNIIANSSFSWWAALLNKNKNKIVIYPDIWLSWDASWLEYMRVPNWTEIPTEIKRDKNNKCCVYPKKKKDL